MADRWVSWLLDHWLPLSGVVASIAGIATRIRRRAKSPMAWLATEMAASIDLRVERIENAIKDQRIAALERENAALHRWHLPGPSDSSSNEPDAIPATTNDGSGRTT